MFNSLKNKFAEYKNQKAFNAENCLNNQIKVEQQNYDRRIEEIQARIKYVVESTTEEHAVIYQVHDYEKKMWTKIKNYFTELGFKVINMQIPDLGNDEYMIISWKKNG